MMKLILVMILAIPPFALTDGNEAGRDAGAMI
jgi:hypothetical protein